MGTSALSQRTDVVGLKKLFKNLTTPVVELDVERLRKFCEDRPGTVSIVDLPPRAEGTVVGEVTSLRIVPRAGSPSLEATLNDGTGSLLVVWTGRRKIAGVAPGKRLVVSGRGAATGPKGRLLMFNPIYELI